VSAEDNRTRNRADLDADSPVGEPGVSPSGRIAFLQSPSAQRVAQTKGDPSGSKETDLTRLRRLLLGQEYERLASMRDDIERMRTLEDTLRDPVEQTDRVAQVLSEALLLRENRDQGVSKALRPALPEAIKAAVRKDPRPVVEAVSPVIGPAIRRSVNEAVAGMLELLDKLLEHNFSWQALQWRLESWRTGRRYSEVVLLRTLIYRVDQVLLIHRETGLLLNHVESSQAGARDPDLVGGMLTAIKDFVSDSFSTSEESPVQTMQVGDFKVIVEQGSLAIIAAIARGNPPNDLARTIRETSETIEILYRDKLERFEGDSTTFADTHPMLEDCLKSQQRTTAGRRSWLAPTVIGLVLLSALGYWGFKSYQAHLLSTSALTALRTEPGIALTDTAQDGDIYRVHGLRDPLAREPEAVIGPDAHSAFRWEWNWRPYFSAEPELLLTRARQLLRPPPTVDLSLDGGVLTLSGEAPQQWIDAMRVAAPGVVGISGYADGALIAIDDTDQATKLWTAALDALRAEPGVVMTEAARDGPIARVNGLLDPLARDPREVIGPEALSGLRWDWNWRPFLSAERKLLLARAEQTLQPPDTVALSLDGSVLQLKGEARREWIDTMRSAVRSIPGITGFEDDALQLIDDKERHREMLANFREQIEGTILRFDVNAVRLALGQLEILDTMAGTMKELETVAGELDLTPGYRVTGFADATGSQTLNHKLSSSRAREVVEQLIVRGISENLFLAVKLGVEMPQQPANTPEERARNRRATVDVILFGDDGNPQMR